MHLSDIYALGIAIGYGIAMYILWRYGRRAFAGLESYGVLVVGIVSMWIVFYASLPFIDENVHRTIYVWVSRAAHTLAIVLIVLLGLLGRAFVRAEDDVGAG